MLASHFIDPSSFKLVPVFFCFFYNFIIFFKIWWCHHHKCVSFLTQSDVEFLQECETVQKWILTRTHNFTLMQRWIVLSSVFACVGLLAFE